MKDSIKDIGRRQFLGQASCAGLGYLTFMNTLLNFKALNAAAISNASVATGNEYKAIVCILLAGGSDSYNMLIPHEQMKYDEYATTRSGLAIPRSNLLQLKRNTASDPAKEFAVHPSMTEIRDLFDQNKAAMLTNVGTLLNTTTDKNKVLNNIDVPLGLYSHSDQIEQWQTGIPSARSSVGWAGKMADIIGSCNSNQNISMNLSMNGPNIFQTGNNTVEYSMSPGTGSVGIADYNPQSNFILSEIRTRTIDSLIAHQYQDIFKQTYIDVIKGARDAHVQFQDALSNAIAFTPGLFPGGYLGSAMETIARTIDVHSVLGFKRQVFYVVFGGWDHHNELLQTQAGMLSQLSQAIGSFMAGLDLVGKQDDVLTMVISEFGRTLGWNGNGSDHAWGGNSMVFGGQNLLNGGKIFGSYPSLEADSPIDVGGGVLIPSLSTDEYFGEVAKWFGVSPSDLNSIFPNLGEFYDSTSSNYPIGFINA